MPDIDSPLDVRSAFTEHGSSLLGYCVNALRDRAEAEDCLQEVFLRAWRSRHTFDPVRGRPRTWLFGIARRVLADALRARAAAPGPVPELPDTAVPAEDPTDRLLLVEALAVLDDDKRAAVVAIHVEGASYADHAARTGVPVGTLRTRVFYGLRAMRAHLEEMEHEDD